MLIRRERPGDERAVHRIHNLAFDATGPGSSSSSGSTGSVGSSGSTGGESAEAVLVDLLRQDPGAWLPRFSLVAEEDELPVGHVVCSRARLRDDVPVLGLGPIGVLPRHQRLGIGSALVHAVCAAAEALDEPLVVLLGDPGYYRRYGFVLAEQFGITGPDPGWAPYFQARPLTAFDPAVHHGPFRYAPAFNTVSG